MDQPVSSSFDVPLSITIDDVARVELIVAEILSCEDVEGSSKLYKLTLDAGSYGTRCVLSGVKKQFAPDDLIGKQGILVANLAPRPMMGTTSQGMLLFAYDTQGRYALATVDTFVENGTRLS